MQAKPRPVVVIVHFNKQASTSGRPWTVHTSRVCLTVSKVIWHVLPETVFKPDKKTNPRGWLRARGVVRVEGTVAHID